MCVPKEPWAECSIVPIVPSFLTPQFTNSPTLPQIVPYLSLSCWEKENLFYGDICVPYMEGIISCSLWYPRCYMHLWCHYYSRLPQHDCVFFMGWRSLDTSLPHIILDLAKPAPPRQTTFSRKKSSFALKRNLNLTFPPSTSQHSCIVGFQETLGGRRKKSNLQRTNGTVKTFSSKGQLWPFLTASIFIFAINILHEVYFMKILVIQESWHFWIK